MRRELYRAVDSVMYGDPASTRDAIDRAHHAASNAQADLARLRNQEPADGDRSVQPVPPREGDPSVQMAQQADQELRATLRLLASAATRPDLPGQDEFRDHLIEARVHAATADNHLDLLQIQLERAARGWDREQDGREQGFGRD